MLVLLFVAASLLSADSPPRAQTPKQWAALDSLTDNQDYLAAAVYIEKNLQGFSKSARPALRLRRCQYLVLSKHSREAQECFQGCAQDQTLDAALRTEARYEGALLKAPQDRRRALWALVGDAPNSNGASRAMAYLVAERKASGGQRARADAYLGLASWVLRRHGLKTGVVFFARALLYAGEDLVELGADTAALEQNLAALSLPTEAGAEVWYFLAQRRGARGDFGGALGALEKIIKSHESSWGAGSYAVPEYDDALLWMGKIYGDMGRRDEALKAYDDLQKYAPNSRLVDDAAYARALLLAQGCRSPGALTAFIRDFPHSRHVRASVEAYRQCYSP